MTQTNAIDFCVSAVSARASELVSQEQWRVWAANPWLPEGMPECKLARVPAMQRRRVERSGRLALEVAFELLDQLDQPQREQATLVFCSRHGDVLRSAGIMKELANAQPASPTQFGLSVHNAVAAQFSIAAGLTNSYSVLSAGKASAEAAVLEAAALLVDHSSVLVVIYDEPLPEDFRTFDDEPVAAHAWGVVLTAPETDATGMPIRLSWCSADPDFAEEASALPATLSALQFVLSEVPERLHSVDGTQWRWQRRAGIDG